VPRFQVLADLADLKEIYLLGCLIDKESSGNSEAINPRDIDGKPRFGILQYDVSTWKEWCVDRFKMRDNIMDANLQVRCAQKMIFEYNQLWRWGTKGLCPF
jgi:hypothetical protein